MPDTPAPAPEQPAPPIELGRHIIAILDPHATSSPLQRHLSNPRTPAPTTDQD